MKKFKSHGIILLSGVALAANPAFAAEQDAAQQLPAVTISEDRSPVDADLAASTESITADTLQHLNIPNTEDAIKYMPNLRVRKRFIGDRNAPIEVRGTSNIQGGRGLVLADERYFVGHPYAGRTLFGEVKLAL
ncbi:MAG: Plug domain-containing protein [Pseudomonadota bacterium]